MKYILCCVVLEQAWSILAKMTMRCFHSAEKEKAGIASFKSESGKSEMMYTSEADTISNTSLLALCYWNKHCNICGHKMHQAEILHGPAHTSTWSPPPSSHLSSVVFGFPAPKLLRRLFWLHTDKIQTGTNHAFCSVTQQFAISIIITRSAVVAGMYFINLREQAWKEDGTSPKPDPG